MGIVQEARCTGFLTGEAGSNPRAGDPQSLNRENQLHVQWLPGSRPGPTPRSQHCGRPFAPFVQVTPTPTIAARGGQPPTWTVRPPASWERHLCMGHAAGKGSEVSGGVSLRQSLCSYRCVRHCARSSGGGGVWTVPWHLSEPAASSSSRENKNTEEVFVFTSVSFITAQRFHLHSLISVKLACGESHV